MYTCSQSADRTLTTTSGKIVIEYIERFTSFSCMHAYMHDGVSFSSEGEKRKTIY